MNNWNRTLQLATGIHVVIHGLNVKFVSISHQLIVNNRFDGPVHLSPAVDSGP
jgi:hypothetical protein